MNTEIKSGYGVHYHKKTASALFDSDTFSADWNCWTAGQWAISSTENNRIWYYESGLDKTGRNALLEHFGLAQWADEFPLEKMISMSPAVLIAARREKETAHDLPRLKVVTDSFGHLPPEEYP